MDTIINFMNDMLASLLETNSQTMSMMIGVAQYIAFGGAFILSSIMAYQMIMGKELDWAKVARIVLVSLGISFYPTFISFVNVPLDAIVQTAQSAVLEEEKISDVLQKEAKAKRDQIYINNVYESELKAYAEENGWEDADPSNWDKLKGIVSNPLTALAYAVDAGTAYYYQAIQDFLNACAKIAIVVLNIIRTFFLMVLVFFGVIAMAFAVYPGFEGSFIQWLQKYINVYLWLAVAYILQGLIVSLSGHVTDFGYMDYVDGGLEQGASGQGFKAISMILALGSIVGMFMVPTITSWIVSASTAGAASKLKQHSRGSAQQIGKATKVSAKTGAGVATGGAATAAAAATSAGAKFKSGL